jgi:4-hydroxybenzoate polyprenyltransferase
MSQQFDTPLCVDLDGTLVETNTLFEALILAIKKNPLRLFVLVAALTQGKAAVKQKIGHYAAEEQFAWLYNSKFLAWLQIEHARGRKLILATASDMHLATSIAAELNIFDEIIASTPQSPVSAVKKYLVLKKRFGNEAFAYAGNSHDDLAVWNIASSAILVHTSEKVARIIKNNSVVEVEFPRETKVTLKDIMQEMRVHQWLKNLLLFVPIVMAHQTNNATLMLQACIGFFSFSTLASSMYVINDLLDIPSDRLHPTKKMRPIARGSIPVRPALLLIAILVLVSFSLSHAFLPPAFFTILASYIVINAIYSIRAKKIPYVDITILAGLYVLRIIAGSAATGITTSAWLFFFAGFLFFCLACMKRVVELLQLQNRTDFAPGRGYQKRDTRMLVALGMTSSLLACIVMGLYIQSESVTVLYARPALLWTLIPLIGVWIVRIWYMTLTKQMNDDPVLFTSKDIVSYVIGFATLGTLFLSAV